MNNKMKRKKSGIVISVILFLFSAVSLIYGIYMVRYSLSYVNTYTGMSAVPADKVMQYIVSSSSIYFGFGILFAACAFIVLFLNGTSRKAADSVPADTDEHPENNPYYIAPTDLEVPVDSEPANSSVSPSPVTPETSADIGVPIPDDSELPADVIHTDETAAADTVQYADTGADVHENQIWQEAELHQVAAFAEHTKPSDPEDPPQREKPSQIEALQHDASSAHIEAAPPQHAVPADSEYHIRPELASDSWLKDAFIKK